MQSVHVQRTPSVNRLKFAVAPFAPQTLATSHSDSTTSSRRPSSLFAKERAAQGGGVDEEEEKDEEESQEEDDDQEENKDEDNSSSIEKIDEISNSEDAESDDTDQGYEEDEEDGMFSDDEDYVAEIPRGPGPTDFAFARPTNYRRSRRDQLRPSAPSTLPPPPRRGRGHIRVVDQPPTGNNTTACTRHCSPPPRSRSGGNAQTLSRASSKREARAGSPSRLSDAGPKGGRAGSPMPSKMRLSSSDEDEEDEDEVQPSPVKVRGGWRSDDAIFASTSRTPRYVSAPITAPVSNDEDEGMTSVTDGVRSFFRRASEHIPGFSRPSIPAQSVVSPIIPQMACAPALDNTPAVASSVSRHEIGESSGGLAHRLERALSQTSDPTPPVDLTRARSMTSKVTFHANAPGRQRDVSVGPGQGKIQPIRCPVQKNEGEDLGWSSEAVLAVRRNIGKHDI